MITYKYIVLDIVLFYKVMYRFLFIYINIIDLNFRLFSSSKIKLVFSIYNII